MFCYSVNQQTTLKGQMAWYNHSLGCYTNNRATADMWQRNGDRVTYGRVD